MSFDQMLAMSYAMYAPSEYPEIVMVSGLAPNGLSAGNNLIFDQ